VAGPDGALWFAESSGGKIGRITTPGAFTEYPVQSSPYYITAGPDGALWFTQGSDGGAVNIGRITTAGTSTEYPNPQFDGSIEITTGPDGALWFTGSAGGVGRITTAGTITKYGADTLGYGITTGPDGALWYAGGNAIYQITTSGAVTPYFLQMPDAQAYGITNGPDGALWFTDSGTNSIGMVVITSLYIATTSLPNATSGQPYMAMLTAGGGGGYTWSLSSGSLPSGFALTQGGVLSTTGSPAAAADTYAFTVKVTDLVGNAVTQQLTLVVQPGIGLQITTATLPNATFGWPYTATLAARGGSGTGYIWSVSSGSLPDGFTLSSGGTLTTTGNLSTAPQTYAFTVKVTDSVGNSATQPLTLVVQPGLGLQITTANLPDATSGQPYNIALAAVGGSTTGYIWSVSSGTLPSGFRLLSEGILTTTGSPSAAAQTYAFTVKVTDSFSNSAIQPLTLVVQSPTAVSTHFFITDLHDLGDIVLGPSALGSQQTVDGSLPFAGVVFDSAGNMYGTANGGGANGPYASYSPPQLGGHGTDIVAGMVWEITASGTYKDLHDFGGTGPRPGEPGYIFGPTVTNANGTSGPDGWGPVGGVTFDSAGNMYGTTPEGGPYGGGASGPEPGDGIVWEITASGTYKDLHDFGATVTNASGTSGPDGVNPQAGVVFDHAGNIYGTASGGGAYGGGIVWEITAWGDYNDLHDFGGTATSASGASGLDGSSPQAGVTFDGAGNMYGTAVQGGPYNVGMVWEITASGTYKDLHDFGGTVTNANGASEPDGAYPVAGVTLDVAGNMYGTADGGGAYGGGIVWEITSGTYKDLHDFGGTVTSANGATGTDGEHPFAGVTLDGSGNMYGTTLEGGPYTNLAVGDGIVWEITASGTYRDLYDFGGAGGPEGFWPWAGVTLDSAGNIYGTTEGSYNNDVPVGCMVWKLAPASTTLPPPSINSGGIAPIYSTVATIMPGEWVWIYGTNLASSTVSWNGNFPTLLGGTSVTINGRAAFLSYVSPTQINLQAPDEVACGGFGCAAANVSVVVTTAGGASTSTVALTASGPHGGAFAAPAFLLLDGEHVAGIIPKSNGSGAYGGGTYDIIGPTGNSLGYPTVAAKAGDTIELFAVGFGPTYPAIPAGQVFSPSDWGWPAPTDNQVNVSINGFNMIIYCGGNPCTVTDANGTSSGGFAGLSGAGLYQINLTLPAGLGTGDVPLVGAVGVLGEGAVQTPPGVVISLQ